MRTIDTLMSDDRRPAHQQECCGGCRHDDARQCARKSQDIPARLRTPDDEPDPCECDCHGRNDR